MPTPRRRGAVLTALFAALIAACGPTVSPSPAASTGAPTASPSTSPAATQSAPSGEPSSPPSTDPSAAPSGEASEPPASENEATYRAIEEAVVPLRGLEPKEDVEPQLMTEDELKDQMAESFSEDNPPEHVAANEILYRSLGMLGEEDSLEELYVELLGSQVAGFYDPEVDELFVITRSGGLGVSERVTYAHEYTHALQDQHFDLESFGLDEVGQGDRRLAVLSLIEGDATAVMYEWMSEELTSDELLAMFEESLDPEAIRILGEMPPILRESLTFPYDRGLQYVSLIREDGGWEAVDEAYADPPVSSEQIIHPEKYASREDPIEVALPEDLAERMGDAWESTYEDTFGEFQLQVWLRHAIGRMDEGSAAAAGWGGDRFAVLEGPDDAWAVVMQTAWDDESEAAEFHAAAGSVLADGDHPATVVIDGTDVLVVVASAGDVLDIAVDAAGPPGG